MNRYWILYPKYIKLFRLCDASEPFLESQRLVRPEPQQDWKLQSETAEGA